MILVAGLTPAWQQILRFPRLRVGEVNRAAEAHGCASGKVLNVGLALARLGLHSETIAPLGGWPREPISAEFAQLDSQAHWIASRSATRVCTTVLDETNGQTTELVVNAAPLESEALAAFQDVYGARVQEASLVVLTGSLPAGTPETFYRELLAVTHAPAILDVRGPELLSALRFRPRVVKPNREELAHTLGGQIDTDSQLIDAMRELVARGAQSVIVSQGSATLWVADGERVSRLTPPAVDRVVNPIGCGDCLAAGIAWGLSEDRPLLDSVRLGMACAAQNVSQLLPARLSAAPARSLAATVACADVDA